MGRKRTPPQYAVDARGSYVPAEATAWDNDRIESETAEMTERGEDTADHPVHRYYAGKTRFDLDALDTIGGMQCRVREYLNQDEPEIWCFRRLRADEWPVVQQYVASELHYKAAQTAFRWCFTGVAGCPVALEAPLDSKGLQAVYDLDPEIVRNVGAAALSYSNPLRYEEKKASGS